MPTAAVAEPLADVLGGVVGGLLAGVPQSSGLRGLADSLALLAVGRNGLLAVEGQVIG